MIPKLINFLICMVIITSCSSHVTVESVQPKTSSSQQLAAISNNPIIPQKISQEKLFELMQQYPDLAETLRSYISPQPESQHPMPIAKPNPNTKIVMPHFKPTDDTHYTMLLVPSDKEIEAATD